MNSRVAILIVASWLSAAMPAVPVYAADDFRPQRVVKPFKPITSFPILSAQNAAGRINDAELVLGVVIGKEARAYPINMLTGPQREILNDTLGGRAMAATW